MSPFSKQKTEAYGGESDWPQRALPVGAGAELRSGRCFAQGCSPLECAEARCRTNENTKRSYFQVCYFFFFLLCLAQIFPTTVFLTTQALRGRLYTALCSSGMICDIGVDIRLQGHLVHPTPSLNLRGNHEPERGRESPSHVADSRARHLSGAPLSHSKRSSVCVDGAAERSPGFTGRKLPGASSASSQGLQPPTGSPRDSAAHPRRGGPGG